MSGANPWSNQESSLGKELPSLCFSKQGAVGGAVSS